MVTLAVDGHLMRPGTSKGEVEVAEQKRQGRENWPSLRAIFRNYLYVGGGNDGTQAEKSNFDSN